MAKSGTGPHPNASAEVVAILRKLEYEDIEMLAETHIRVLADSIAAEFRRRWAKGSPRTKAR